MKKQIKKWWEKAWCMALLMYKHATQSNTNNTAMGVNDLPQCSQLMIEAVLRYIADNVINSDDFGYEFLKSTIKSESELQVYGKGKAPNIQCTKSDNNHLTYEQEHYRKSLNLINDLLHKLLQQDTEFWQQVEQKLQTVISPLNNIIYTLQGENDTLALNPFNVFHYMDCHQTCHLSIFDIDKPKQK